MLAAFRLQYSQSLPWVILLLAGVALLVVFVYPAQLRQIPRGLRWLLPTLRILAVSFIGLSILRPVMTRPRVAGERAPVVILLDDSASMGVVDFNRPPAEWVGIAAAMGKLPAEARDKQLDAVQGDCDRLSAQADDVTRARAELDYAKLSGRGVEPAQSRLDRAIEELQSTARDASQASSPMHATSLAKVLAYLVRLPVGVDRDAWLDRIRDKARIAASYAEQARFASDGQLYRSDDKVRDACHPLQSLSRLQLSESAVLDPDTGLLARLGAETSVLGYGISDQVTPFVTGNHPGNLRPLSANGSVSNLTGGAAEILQSLKLVPPRAMIIFSDGRLNNADTDAATFADLQGVPIYTVGVATRAGLKDLSITNATVPSTAMIGETVTLDAELRDFGMGKITTDLKITGGGFDETRQITFPDDRTINVSFNRRFTAAGLQRLTLQMTDVPGELSYENNRVERWVSVSNISHPAATTRPATRPAIEAEMADLTGDEGLLRRLSEASGGQFLRLDQVDLLPKKLGEIHDDAGQPVEIPLWDGGYLYALVLGCLVAEWGLRKRFGLA